MQVALADFASDMSIDLRLSCIGSLVAALFAGFVDRGTASESDPHQITPLPLISALLSGSMTVLHDCVNVLPDAPCVLCLGSILHPDQMVSAGLSIVKHVLGMLPSSDSAALSTRVGIMNAVCKTFMRGSSDDGVVNVSHMRAPHTLLLCDTIVQGGAAAARIPGLVEFIQALLAHHGIEVITFGCSLCFCSLCVFHVSCPVCVLLSCGLLATRR